MGGRAQRKYICGIMNKVIVGGVAFDDVTLREAIDFISSRISEGVGGVVVTPNIDILRQCAIDGNVAKMVGDSDLILADGSPVVLASRLAGTPLRERVAGSDLTAALIASARDSNHRVFLLGGSPGVAETLAKTLAGQYPGINCDFWCPPVGFEKSQQELDAIERAIRGFRPHLVFVALGFPKQERLIQTMRHAQSTAWWLGVGASLSFMAGDIPRAPRILRTYGLEWAHRLAMEPRRLFRRYLIHDLPFAIRLLSSAFVNRR